MPLLNLPEPANWSETGRVSLAVRLGLTVALMYVIFEGGRALVAGSYLTTAVWFGTFSLAFVITAMLVMAATARVTARTSTDATGFTVWPDKRLAAAYFAGLTVTAPAALLFAILLPRGMIDIPMSRGLQIFSPPALYALCLISVIGLISGVRRKGVGYLKFTPAMIEIADVLRTRLLEWDDVVDVRDHASNTKANRAGPSVVLCLRDGSEQVIGGLNLYVPGGAALYWLVRHYWKHPEDRGELVDDRALQRLKQGQYDLK